MKSVIHLTETPRYVLQCKKMLRDISKLILKFTYLTLYMTGDLLYFNTFRPVVSKLFRPPPPLVP
jgi:hypothetical protein